MPTKTAKIWFFPPDLTDCFQTFQSILMLFTKCLLHGPTETPTNLFTIKHHIKVPILTCLNGFRIRAVEIPRASFLSNHEFRLLQCEHSKYSSVSKPDLSAPNTENFVLSKQANPHLFCFTYATIQLMLAWGKCLCYHPEWFLIIFSYSL